jgi:hypothetical protein
METQSAGFGPRIPSLKWLRHNLNAQAIASLKGEAASIQGEITRLIEEMNRSIARADEFVKGL